MTHGAAAFKIIFFSPKKKCTHLHVFCPSVERKKKNVEECSGCSFPYSENEWGLVLKVHKCVLFLYSSCITFSPLMVTCWEKMRRSMTWVHSCVQKGLLWKKVLDLGTYYWCYRSFCTIDCTFNLGVKPSHWFCLSNVLFFCFHPPIDGFCVPSII